MPRIKYLYLVLVLLVIPFLPYPVYAQTPFLNWLHNLQSYNTQIENHVQENPESSLVFNTSNGTELMSGFSNSTTGLLFEVTNATNPLVFDISNGTNLAFVFSGGPNPYQFSYANASNNISFETHPSSFSGNSEIIIKGTENPPTGLVRLFLNYNGTIIDQTQSIEDLDGNFIVGFYPQSNWQAGDYTILAMTSLHQNQTSFVWN